MIVERAGADPVALRRAGEALEDALYELGVVPAVVVGEAHDLVELIAKPDVSSVANAGPGVPAMDEIEGPGEVGGEPGEHRSPGLGRHPTERFGGGRPLGVGGGGTTAEFRKMMKRRSASHWNSQPA